MAAVLAFGWFPDTSARLDPLYTTVPFQDNFANLLVSPAARFDSAWYLAISDFGYEVSGRAAFFPLFPGMTALGGSIIGSPLVAGILISSLCGLGSLYLLHRLVALDFDADLARTTVWIVAWFPSAFVLSAVYTEALFLALSIGSLYAGRLGNGPLAALLGGLAAASRSGGLLLIDPAADPLPVRAARRPPRPRARGHPAARAIRSAHRRSLDPGGGPGGPARLPRLPRLRDR